jgi:light-regulated signal transduction histidine kinase (bacteriophytochrome)
LSEIIAEKDVKITYDSLPIIRGHSFQLKQLFLNLLTNSIKFARESIKPIIEIDHDLVKGSPVAVIPKQKRSGFFHKITVRDNGIGFDSQYADKIFIIFQRLHNRNTYEGTGIGLAICKRIVENHAGYIVAEGTLNKGAIFTIYLPAEEGTSGQ